MLAEGEAGAEKARTDCVQGKFEQMRDLQISQPLEFTKKQHFAIDGVEAGEALAKPQNFIGVSECAHHKFGFDVGTKEERAKSCFAMVGAEDFESNRVEIGANKRARLITCRGADHGKESFLGEFFGAGPVRRAAADKSENTLVVAREKFVEGGGVPVREGEHELVVGLGIGLRRVSHPGIQQIEQQPPLTLMSREWKKFP